MRQHTRAVQLALPLAVLAGLALGACASTSPSGTGPGTSAGSSTGLSTDANGQWQLVAASDAAGAFELGSTAITLTVADGEASGNAGCNSYGTTVSLSDSGIRFDGIRLTRKLCEEPVMQLEQRYLDALRSIDSAALAGEQLALTAAGTELLFEPLETTTRG